MLPESISSPSARMPDQRTPDYDALKNKAALVSYSFGLKRRVVEIDRDADRRWMFASMKARAEEAEGKEPSDSAPFEDLYKFSKETAETVHKFLAEANSASSAPAGLKKDIEKVLKENPPSDDFKVRFPRVLHERLAKKMAPCRGDPLIGFPLFFTARELTMLICSVAVHPELAYPCNAGDRRLRSEPL